MSAWGVEARVPFLDREFLDVAMSVNPKDKMITEGKMEKQILREAFSDLLPEEIVWRQKEQFSDGVGYSWIDGIRDYAKTQVSERQMAHAAKRFPFNTPARKRPICSGDCLKATIRWPVRPSVCPAGRRWRVVHAGSGFVGQESPGNG